VLDAVSHCASKPSADFNESIVGFGEDSPVVFTIRIGCAVHVFSDFQNSSKTLIGIEQIDNPPNHKITETEENLCRGVHFSVAC
jgi:hypothetical protein